MWEALEAVINENHPQPCPRPGLRQELQLSPSVQAPESREPCIAFTSPLHHLDPLATSLQHLSAPDEEAQVDPSGFHINTPSLSCFFNHPRAAAASWPRALGCWMGCLTLRGAWPAGTPLGRAPGPRGCPGAVSRWWEQPRGTYWLSLGEVVVSLGTCCPAAEQPARTGLVTRGWRRVEESLNTSWERTSVPQTPKSLCFPLV